MKTVYLAGPIEDCTDEEILQWRAYLKDLLEDGIRVISPRRMSSNEAAEILMQSYMDVKQCDVVLVYLPKAISDRRCSYGTICELAWAYASQSPLVVVSDDSYVHKHPMVRKMGVHFKELLPAADYINQLLIDYVT
jgi:nucleoside 2-deoxyribosyltransferase